MPFAHFPLPNQFERLPSLKSLQAFEATARLRSFSLAAAELNVTQSAISHQIKSLEQQLALSLLERSQQPLQLTESGATLYTVLQESFFQMRAVCRHLTQQQRRPLSIVAQTSVAVEWLAPRLAHFQQLHPQIETLLHMESAANSVAVAEFDIVIGTWPCPTGFHSQPLPSEWWFPVCNPTTFQQLDLTDANSVYQFPLYTSEQGQDWQLWRQQVKATSAEIADYRQVSLALLATKAIMASPGMALSNSFIAADAVREGRLMALTHWCYQLPWGQYQLHFRAASQREVQVQHFIQWFLQQMQCSRLVS